MIIAWYSVWHGKNNPTWRRIDLSSCHGNGSWVEPGIRGIASREGLSLFALSYIICFIIWSLLVIYLCPIAYWNRRQSRMTTKCHRKSSYFENYFTMRSIHIDLSIFVVNTTMLHISNKMWTLTFTLDSY